MNVRNVWSEHEKMTIAKQNAFKMIKYMFFSLFVTSRTNTVYLVTSDAENVQ